MHKGGLVKPLACSAAIVSGKVLADERLVRNGPALVSGARSYSGKVIARAYSERFSGLRLRGAGNLPVTQRMLHQPVRRVRRKRDIPYIIHHQRVADIEVARSPVRARIIVVRQQIALVRSGVHALGPGISHAEQKAPAQPPLQVDLQRVVDRAALVGILQDRRIAAVRAQCIRLRHCGICLHRARLQLVDILQLLQVNALSAHIRRGQRGKVGYLLLQREVPRVGLGAGQVVGLGGELQWKRCCSCAARVVDRAACDRRRRLERCVAARLHLVGNWQPLHKTPRAAANHRVRQYLVRETETRLQVRVHRLRIVAPVAAEQPVVLAVQDRGRHMALRRAGEVAARDHHAIKRIAACRQPCCWIDRRRERRIVRARIEHRLIAPGCIEGRIHGIIYAVLQQQLRRHPPGILREYLVAVSAEQSVTLRPDFAVTVELSQRCIRDRRAAGRHPALHRVLERELPVLVAGRAGRRAAHRDLVEVVLAVPLPRSAKLNRVAAQYLGQVIAQPCNHAAGVRWIRLAIERRKVRNADRRYLIRHQLSCRGIDIRVIDSILRSVQQSVGSVADRDVIGRGGEQGLVDQRRADGPGIVQHAHFIRPVPVLRRPVKVPGKRRGVVVVVIQQRKPNVVRLGRHIVDHQRVLALVLRIRRRCLPVAAAAVLVGRGKRIQQRKPVGAEPVCRNHVIRKRSAVSRIHDLHRLAVKNVGRREQFAEVTLPHQRSRHLQRSRRDVLAIADILLPGKEEQLLL